MEVSRNDLSEAVKYYRDLHDKFYDDGGVEMEIFNQEEYEKRCMVELQNMSCGAISMDSKRFNYLWELKCKLEEQGKY